MMLSALCPNVNRKQDKRTLVLFPGSLGDLVCALPAIRAIKRQSKGDLILAVRGEAFDLASLFSCVSEVRSLEEQVFSHLFSSPTLLQREAREFFSSFSRIISWYGHSRAEVAENLRLLIGEQFSSFPFFVGQEDCHAVAYYLRCLGVDTLQCPSLHICEPAIQWQSRYRRQRGFEVEDQILLLHPGSGGKRKCWEVEGFQKVAQWWKYERQGRSLILLGPAETYDVEQWRRVGDVESGLSLWQVAALLSQSAFYLGNDSGVSHVAGAVGARGVVIFGPTKPQLWRPLGGSLAILRNNEYRINSPSIAGISLNEVSVEQVIEKLTVQGG